MADALRKQPDQPEDPYLELATLVRYEHVNAGRVVLVNFWATWCPPCRKEMPDLDALYQKFKDRGLIVLAISDEDAAKVRSYIQEHKVSYPILLDPGRQVNEAFQIEGIPKSFVGEYRA